MGKPANKLSAFNSAIAASFLTLIFVSALMVLTRINARSLSRLAGHGIVSMIHDAFNLIMWLGVLGFTCQQYVLIGVFQLSSSNASLPKAQFAFIALSFFASLGCFVSSV